MSTLGLRPRPAPFVVMSTLSGTYIVNRNDSNNDGDRCYGVGSDLLTQSCYEPTEVAVVLMILQLRKRLVGAGVVAIDCGANIGVHTVEWARAMYGWGNVIAVEPQEPIYWALAGNLAINNCFNATALHGAVGAECGEIFVPSLDYSRPSSFGSLELRPGPRTQPIGQPVDYSPSCGRPVKMFSIDSLSLDRIDFIKMDVEGMELEALAGAAHSIGRFRPMMLVETIKVDGPALLGLLEDAGYRTVNVGQMNLLAVHREDPCCEHIRSQWREG